MTAYYPIANGTTVETDGYFAIPGNFTLMFTPGFQFVAVFNTTGSPVVSTPVGFKTLSSSYSNGYTLITPNLSSGSPPPSLGTGSPSSVWVTLVGGAYSLDFSDPGKTEIMIEVADIDQSTSLTFPGRAALNYGEHLNEDLLHLLENFAYSQPPSNPIEGQLWYDNNSTTLNVQTDGSPSWSQLLSEAIANSIYLRLDTTNDPLTSTLTINGGGSPQLALVANGDIEVNSQIRGSDGSVGVPTYSFLSNPSTGMLNPSSGVLQLVTDGIEQIQVSGSLHQFFTTSQGSPSSAQLRLSINNEGALIVQETTTTPVSTTNKLYNVSGDLYWNGSNLVTSSSTSLGDLDDVDDDVSDGSPLPTIGEVLTWDGGQWTNQPTGTGGGVLFDEIIVSGSPISLAITTTNVIPQSKTGTTSYQQVFRNGILQRESTGSPADGNYVVSESPMGIIFLIPLNENDEILVYQL